MLKELKTQHREIARLSFQGFKPAEISDRTGTALQTVYQILSDPLCKSFVAGMNDKADLAVIDTKQRLASLDTKAVDTLDDLLSFADTPASVQLAAAKDVLDRNGHKPAEKHQHLHGHFTSEELSDLRNRMRLAKAANE